ncbi:MAG: N-acetyltransferase, partial [Mesorhizobium sp.]
MGFHLSFFIFLSWRTKMVAEAEDTEDESYAIDCP